MKSFKLFDIGTRQVMVERLSDDEGERVTVITHTKGMRLAMSYIFNDEKRTDKQKARSANKCFSEYDEAKAKQFLKVSNLNKSTNIEKLLL